jgi:hypothetical protein
MDEFATGAEPGLLSNVSNIDRQLPKRMLAPLPSEVMAVS